MLFPREATKSWKTTEYQLSCCYKQAPLNFKKCFFMEVEALALFSWEIRRHFQANYLFLNPTNQPKEHPIKFHLSAKWSSQQGPPASRTGDQLLSLNEPLSWEKQNDFELLLLELQMPITSAAPAAWGDGNPGWFSGGKAAFPAECQRDGKQTTKPLDFKWIFWASEVLLAVCYDRRVQIKERGHKTPVLTLFWVQPCVPALPTPAWATWPSTNGQWKGTGREIQPRQVTP